MEQLFSIIQHEWMIPSFREHAESLCRDINLFLVSKGKNPDRYPTLVSFMKKTELAEEYIHLAGDIGVTPITIDGYIDDDWLAGYWGWVEDGGSVAILSKLGLDAPGRNLVLVDLLEGGIARINRLMGLIPSPESFRLAKDLSRHVLSAAVREDIDFQISNGAEHSRMAVITLGRLLGTRQYRHEESCMHFKPEDISLINGEDETLFDSRFFAHSGAVYNFQHPDLEAMEFDDGTGPIGLSKLDVLEKFYRATIQSDVDLYGKLGKVHKASKMIQPVIGTHLYHLVEQGQEDLVWRSALGRITLLGRVFPTKSTQEYVNASIALMLVKSVERDLFIELPCQAEKQATEQYLQCLWADYDANERQAVMAVLSVMAYGGLMDLHVDPSIGEPAGLFKTLANPDCPVEDRIEALDQFEGVHLNAAYSRQLWPLLIAHSKALSTDRLLTPLIPHLAVAWKWGQDFYHRSKSDPLYGAGILAHDGWKHALGKSPDNTVKALTIAHRERLLDLEFSASLNVTGEVLRCLDFKLPSSMVDQTLSADLGL